MKHKASQLVEKETEQYNQSMSTTLINISPETDVTERKIQEYTFEKDDLFDRKSFALQLNQMIVDSRNFKRMNHFQ